jgi:hypothetical protein
MLLSGNTCGEDGLAALGIAPMPFTEDNLAYLTAPAA